MKKRTNKKGFTLVELLVVIGIIAVLAVVSVVGYFGFIKKANVSNDISLTTQMNRILQANEASGDTYATPHDAMKALEEGGLDVTKLTPTADGYSYIYDQNGEQGKKMILVDESMNVKAPEGVSLSSSKERYFVFVSTKEEVEKYTNEGYSVYLKEGFTTNMALEVKAGLDVGDNEGVNANYTNTTKKEVTIRTNGGILTIDAENDTVNHYGDTIKVNVKAVANESYHEFGKADSVDFAKGRFVAETGSEVSFLNVTATNARDVAGIEVKSGSEVVAVIAKNDTVAKAIEEKVSGSGSTKVYKENDVKNKTVYVNNNGTTEMFDTINDSVKKYSKSTIKLLKDITEDVVISSNKNIVLDLNNKTIQNNSSDTIKVELKGSLTINGEGVVDNVTHGKAAIFNNGTTILNGGKYTRSKEASTSTDSSNGNSYYNILNHGVMTINKGVEVISTGAFSSLVANGYFNYNDTTNERSGYVEGTNVSEPKLTINGGSFSGGINTIKNDDNATLVVNDGTYSNVTQSVIFNVNKAYINGGIFIMPSEGENHYSVLSKNYSTFPNNVYTEIHGGEFNGIVKNESTDKSKLVIYGGTFNSKVEGDYTDKR